MDYEPPQERETRSITADSDLWLAVDEIALRLGNEPGLTAAELMAAGAQRVLAALEGNLAGEA